MKRVDVKSSTCFNSDKENKERDTKFNVGDHVKISKYKSIFAKDYVSNWPQEASVIKKVKHTVPWTYERIDGTFYEKELKKSKSNRI